MDILIPVLTLGMLGLLFGIGLTFAHRVFNVQQDPKLDEVMHVLPGSNCGACGMAGCFAMAEALLGKKAEPTACALAGQEGAEKIAKILGVGIKAQDKKFAEVICNGGRTAIDKYENIGVQDCVAASILGGGQKACRFGCLGFGTCVKACPVGAIVMDEQGLPVIAREKCIGCGKCEQICPKHIIKMFPSQAEFFVKCASTDAGAQVMKACKNGCIACGKCVKVCPGNAIRIVDNLATIDYAKCTRCEECVKVCPTKVIKKIAVPQEVCA